VWNGNNNSSLTVALPCSHAAVALLVKGANGAAANSAASGINARAAQDAVATSLKQSTDQSSRIIIDTESLKIEEVKGPDHLDDHSKGGKGLKGYLQEGTIKPVTGDQGMAAAAVAAATVAAAIGAVAVASASAAAQWEMSYLLKAITCTADQHLPGRVLAADNTTTTTARSTYVIQQQSCICITAKQRQVLVLLTLLCLPLPCECCSGASVEASRRGRQQRQR
jgi:hypothetical protein